ncbi:C39 family peptidase [Eubacteriaceae bacterium ES2]|nr:C39 family peptidase [Eubacteriaceae bacterium ES2]
MKKFITIVMLSILMIGIFPAVSAQNTPSLTYQTHIENVGWQALEKDGEMSGTSGQSLRLEGIKINLNSSGYDLAISYQTHIQNIGWEEDSSGWKNDGEMSGTEGLSYRLEAIQIKLTGNNANLFDIYYQVHAQNVGWMGWAKNGESSGTAGYSYRLESIRIVVVPKGENPPSTTINNESAFLQKKSVSSNLMLHDNTEVFDEYALGLDGIVLTDAGITLDPTSTIGVYTSKEMKTSAFNKMVCSWNVTTPENSLIQLEARVFTSSGWSDWLSWGQWGSNIERRSGTGTMSDAIASVDVDTLVVKNGLTATGLQYRVILLAPRAGITPTVSLVAAALRNTVTPIGKTYTDNPDLTNLPILTVPLLSQMMRDPAIADSICSPTSMSMIINYYGTNVSPETAAWGIYDYDFEDFGNWSFNTAYAGSFGYQAYVDYTTIEGLKREILAGHPVAVAVAYKNSAGISGNLPVVDGAPITSTTGHLIVVCGFTFINGIEYVVVNDPAARSDAGVRVYYRLDQFSNAWAQSGNIAYIVK